MARKKNPLYFAAALLAASLTAVSYKVYEVFTKKDLAAPAKYTKKSIALTLLHSVLNLDLPLNEILLNCDNVTFILPPHLSVDDLACKITTDSAGSRVYELPQTLVKNYKLLRCSNIDGYFHVLRNLKPDLLYVCPDDLGISDRAPPDLRRFVKEIVNIDQDRNTVQTVLSKVFLR